MVGHCNVQCMAIYRVRIGRTVNIILLFCSVTGPNEQYYLLSDVLPEDKSLRNFLQKKTLVCISYIWQQIRGNKDVSCMNLSVWLKLSLKFLMKFGP